MKRIWRRMMRRGYAWLWPRFYFLSGGLLAPPAPVPLRIEWFRSPDPTGVQTRPLFVMLPGRGDCGGDFIGRGFAAAVEEAGLNADVVTVDASMGYYLRQTLTTRLREDLIGPERSRGRRQIWLVGISMGGLGSLLYRREFPEDVSGLVLMAPFLGHNGRLFDSIREAGGPATWQPEPDQDLDGYQAVLWRWLRESAIAGQVPPIWLGYGTDDYLVAGMRLLAELLPPAQTLTVSGGHTWAVWKQLWPRLLEQVGPVLNRY